MVAGGFPALEWGRLQKSCGARGVFRRRPILTNSKTFQNPLLPSGPDPWVAQKDGFYYYLHTTNTDLTIWKTPTMAGLRNATSRVVWTPSPQSAAAGNLWAPELYFLDGKWYIYYSAGPAGTNLGLQRTWVLENAAPTPPRAPGSTKAAFLIRPPISGPSTARCWSRTATATSSGRATTASTPCSASTLLADEQPLDPDRAARGAVAARSTPGKTWARPT